MDRKTKHRIISVIERHNCGKTPQDILKIEDELHVNIGIINGEGVYSLDDYKDKEITSFTIDSVGRYDFIDIEIEKGKVIISDYEKINE
jgi:hypothetical protein